MAGSGMVVVVTGASRGVGYAVGRELACRLPGATLYLTTRQATAVEELQLNLRRQIGVAADNVRFRYLDLKEKRSTAKFVEVVKRRHNRLDILVNNAAVYHKPPASVHKTCASLPLYYKEVDEIVKTNYVGLRAVTEQLLPCLAGDARIVNMTSHLAVNLFDCTSTDPAQTRLAAAFSQPGLTLPALDALVKSFLASIKSGTWSQAGWPDCAYSVTKLAVNAYTRILQGKLGKSQTVNAVCPGTMHSKMRQTREETISVSDSADMLSYLATLRLEGVGDCTVPHSALPRGSVLWHDLTPVHSSQQTGSTRADTA